MLAAGGLIPLLKSGSKVFSPTSSLTPQKEAPGA
jgi:hypothetical protein